MNDYDECHIYLSHLHSEHNRLELLTKNVADRLRQSTDEAWPDVDRPEVAARLAALRDELCHHVEIEDQGGCVDEAVARMPSLSQEAKRVYAENDELKQQLQNVTRLVQFGSRTKALNAFLKFASELRVHEEHEARLVEKGMNVFRHQS